MPGFDWMRTGTRILARVTRRDGGLEDRYDRWLSVNVLAGMRSIGYPGFHGLQDKSITSWSWIGMIGRIHEETDSHNLVPFPSEIGIRHSQLSSYDWGDELRNREDFSVESAARTQSPRTDSRKASKTCVSSLRYSV